MIETADRGGSEDGFPALERRLGVPQYIINVV